MKEPSRLTLETLHDVVSSDSANGKRIYFSKEGIMMVFGVDNMMRKFLTPSTPYLIEDYRMGVVCRGRVHGRVNLIEYEVSEGSLLFITPGSIVEPIEVSDDLLIQGIGLSPEVFHAVCHHHLPEIFNGQMKDGRQVLDDSQMRLTLDMLKMLWQILHSETSSREVKYNMIATYLHHVSDIFSSARSSQPVRRPVANEVFDRFLYLVNTHACRHHHLAFYADKMCLTERYLGTLVRQASGVTAKEWIDRAIITSARVMLKHGNKQIGQISDELNFPNASFFCKYFRRLTGCTPQEYRSGT